MVKILARLEHGASWCEWVAGRWGIDALVGAQTRPRADLDLAVGRPDCGLVQAALEPLGLIHDTWVEPGLPARVVVRTDRGHQVDLQLQLLRHLGYPLDDDDRHDLRMLATHYHLPLRACSPETGPPTGATGTYRTRRTEMPMLLSTSMVGAWV